MDSGSIRANRTFLLLWSANGTSLVGFHLVRIAYPLLALAETGSPAAAGWAGFALSVPSLVFQLYAGVIVDRLDRVRILLWCQWIGLAAAAVATFAAWSRPPGFALILLLAAFVEGSMLVFVNLAELAVTRDVVSVEQRAAAFALLESEKPIASLLGRAVGAALFGVARWLPFLLNTVTYLYSAGSLTAARSKIPAVERDSSPHGTLWRDIAEGLHVVWREPVLRVSTAMIAASNIVIQVVLLLIMVELQADGRPMWVIGFVLAAAGVGGIAGTSWATWLLARIEPRRVYRMALWAWTLLLAPVALSDNPFVLALCWGGVGCVGVVSNVALTVYRVAVTPEQILGRAVATINMVLEAAIALGALGAGYLTSTLGLIATRGEVVAAMGILALCAVARIFGAPEVEGRRVRRSDLHLL
ncbi:MFS transporter [Nocardia panacis]|nr:MFS transporter [Nocardia panacis]